MDWSWGPADTWHATQRFLEGFSSTLPELPKALLVVSGHWEAGIHGKRGGETRAHLRLFRLS
jgi:hypothetical protein